jgi:hypothetical protein
MVAWRRFYIVFFLFLMFLVRLRTPYSRFSLRFTYTPSMRSLMYFLIILRLGMEFRYIWKETL